MLARFAVLEEREQRLQTRLAMPTPPPTAHHAVDAPLKPTATVAPETNEQSEDAMLLVLAKLKEENSQLVSRLSHGTT